MKLTGIFSAIAFAIAFTSSMATAQEFERVALHKDWNVFAGPDGNSCFIATRPESSTASRGGQDVTSSVSRGDIMLYVTSVKSEGLTNEVSFEAGYPFKDGSTVSVRIGSGSHELFTEGSWAWPNSTTDDAKIVGAMRRGSSARISGLSSRGTTTVDTFSLLGFTDALSDANSRCGVTAQ